jgi:hypothetical protein
MSGLRHAIVALVKVTVIGPHRILSTSILMGTVVIWRTLDTFHLLVDVLQAFDVVKFALCNTI